MLVFGKTRAVYNFRLRNYQKIHAQQHFETLVPFYQTVRCHVSEDCRPRPDNDCRDKFESQRRPQACMYAEQPLRGIEWGSLDIHPGRDTVPRRRPRLLPSEHTELLTTHCRSIVCILHYTGWPEHSRPNFRSWVCTTVQEQSCQWSRVLRSMVSELRRPAN